MRRLCIAGAAALMLLAFSAPPAVAIVRGDPDPVHTNVGAILYESTANPGLFGVFCTGALLSPDTVLTAGHAVAPLLGWGDLQAGRVYFSPQQSFTPSSTAPGYVEAPATMVRVTGWHVHPGYRPGGVAKAYNDVAVFELASPILGLAPVELPDEWALRELAVDHELAAHRFVVTGYGLRSLDRSVASPMASWEESTDRRMARMSFMALTPTFLKLSGNASARGGGIACFGDSGGPAFWNAASNVVLATMTAADPTCGTLNEWQRLDTPGVLGWLEQYD